MKMEGEMKQSTQLQIMAIIVIILFGILDVIAMYVPLVAIGALVILLFKPKWFFNLVRKLYEE